MSRTVFVLQTQHQPTVNELEVMRAGLLADADKLGPKGLSCVAVAPKQMTADEDNVGSSILTSGKDRVHQ